MDSTLDSKTTTAMTIRTAVITTTGHGTPKNNIDDKNENRIGDWRAPRRNRKQNFTITSYHYYWPPQPDVLLATVPAAEFNALRLSSGWAQPWRAELRLSVECNDVLKCVIFGIVLVPRDNTSTVSTDKHCDNHEPWVVTPGFWMFWFFEYFYAVITII